MRFRKEIIVEVSKDTKLDFGLLNRMRASLPVTYLRPKSPGDIPAIINMLRISKSTRLSLAPLVPSMRGSKDEEDKATQIIQKKGATSSSKKASKATS
jgi:hypothetical protein